MNEFIQSARHRESALQRTPRLSQHPSVNRRISTARQRSASATVARTTSAVRVTPDSTSPHCAAVEDTDGVAAWSIPDMGWVDTLLFHRGVVSELMLERGRKTGEWVSRPAVIHMRDGEWLKTTTCARRSGVELHDTDSSGTPRMQPVKVMWSLVGNRADLAAAVAAYTRAIPEFSLFIAKLPPIFRNGRCKLQYSAWVTLFDTHLCGERASERTSFVVHGLAGNCSRSTGSAAEKQSLLEDRTQLREAMLHFSFHHSRGAYILELTHWQPAVTQHVVERVCFHTNAVSRSVPFGRSLNQGRERCVALALNHRCNSLCKALELPPLVVL